MEKVSQGAQGETGLGHDVLLDTAMSWRFGLSQCLASDEAARRQTSFNSKSNGQRRSWTTSELSATPNGSTSIVPAQAQRPASTAGSGAQGRHRHCPALSEKLGLRRQRKKLFEIGYRPQGCPGSIVAVTICCSHAPSSSVVQAASSPPSKHRRLSLSAKTPLSRSRVSMPHPRLNSTSHLNWQ